MPTTKKNLPRTGFTLIELMVTISIIAILATVGYVLYSSSQATARDSKRVSDLQEIQKALEQYYFINRNYPTGLAWVSTTTYFQNGTVPSDPKNSPPYTYTSYWCANGTGSSKYILCTKLENCSGKCNRTAIPPDACSQAAGDGTTPANGYYCISSLSN